MPTPIDPRGQDNATTYFVDKNSDAEMIRLMIQDSTVTACLGGPLVEQPDPAQFRNVLDVGCGPGGWMLEMATAYPAMHLIGIDISWKMIEYAHASAQSRNLAEHTEFHVMDARKPLAFPPHTFDLINLRFGGSFILKSDWTRVMQEFLRVLRPGGTIRIVEGDTPYSTGKAHTRLYTLVREAAILSQHSIQTSTSINLKTGFSHLFTETGCKNIHVQERTIEYGPNTFLGQNFYRTALYTFQTFRPFLQKTGVIPADYDTLYDQALTEMQQDNFQAWWYILTIWGTKP